MATELKKFYELVDQIEIAMMTTRRPDGHLESRAMANQKRAAGADLWFVSAEGTAKLRDIAADPHVNLAYYKDRTREWISVCGIAKISRDRRRFVSSTRRIGRVVPGRRRSAARHGDDPRMVLIGVDIHAAVFLEVDKPQPVVLYELAKGWLTGTEPDIGEMHHLSR